MHWDKSPGRPYQGVRVRDPVRELLRRKRGLEQHDAPGTAPPAVDGSPHHNPCPYSTGSSFGFEGDNAVQSGGGLSPFGETLSGEWATGPQGGHSLQTGPQSLQTPAWSSGDSAQQQDPSSALGPQPYSLSRGLAGDMYRQALCPSYALLGPPRALLAYTHTPILTSFGLPQMECPDAGLAYIPWGAPPLALPAPVQLAAGSGAPPRVARGHMPPSGPGPAPLAHAGSTVTPLEAFRTAGLEFPQEAEEDLHPHQLHPDLDASMEQAAGPLDHLVEQEMESMNPLEKLLEDHNKGGGEEGGKGRYSNSLFLADI